jgi:hypothetical protein
MILSRLNRWRHRLDMRKKRRAYEHKITRLLARIPPPHVTVDPQAMTVSRYRPRYRNTAWHEAYGTFSGIHSNGYLPEDLYYTEIESRLNEFAAAGVYRDKICLGFFLPPEDYVGNRFFRHAGIWHDQSGYPVHLETVERWLADQPEVVFKPAGDSGGGRAVAIGGAGAISAEIARTRHDAVLQEVFEQHPDLARFNASSINTIRLLSLRVAGEVRPISALVRLGCEGSRVDNVVRGAVAVGITGGQLGAFGSDRDFGKHTHHPSSGIALAGSSVPSWPEVCELAVRSHNRFVHAGIVSWDVVVGADDRPRILEANLREQGINEHQLLNGPVFAPYLEMMFDGGARR